MNVESILIARANTLLPVQVVFTLFLCGRLVYKVTVKYKDFEKNESTLRDLFRSIGLEVVGFAVALFFIWQGALFLV